MAQTKDGALKQAAALIGISVDEYTDHITRGEKRCRKCTTWLPVGSFGKDKTRGDGLASACQTCRRSSDLTQPGRPERIAQKAAGFGWCKACAAWLPLTDMSNSMCRQHVNEYDRKRYASNPEAAFKIRNRVSLRRRGVESVPPDMRNEVLERCGHACLYCGGDPETVDHLDPVSKGGKTVLWNVTMACKSCNSRKKDMAFDTWVDKLRDSGVALRDELMDMMTWRLSI